ncbi:hypothetical protein KUL72_20055 [Bradyrhizobium arachidis]|uniref:hypothetical protein n=1 Tax=Bradyrhizobium TaxID=374 RepID=UPI00188BDB3C|nr:MULTISPECIES: hypothetical protein [Bradyrhizobium]MDN4982353.1 hypothetical protein [Bradyrhizobium sp. WYCCWR 13022]UVO33816.1 hypothetical protein KUL72_20055 [Bradyrhizobium arachidis]
MSIDRTSARALVEAGYMPLSEYVRLFGETDTAPDIVPSVDAGAREGSSQEADAAALKPEV